MAKKKEVTRQRLFALAGAAQVDPRTVARVLAGKPTRTMARERVEAALKAERP